MQISSFQAGRAGASPDGVAAAVAVLNDPRGAAGLARQLDAYQSLAARWRAARPDDRSALAQALTESPFARRVQSTLNSFTRAAWAGPDAVPPAPQAQMLKAFDSLPEEDRQIVAAMQTDASGAPAFRSAADYRKRLQADLEAAQAAAPPERRPDSVTLSDEALARLAGGAGPEPVQPPTPADPQVASAIQAYTKATR